MEIRSDSAVTEVKNKKGQLRLEEFRIEFERVSGLESFECKLGNVPNCPVAVL